MVSKKERTEKPQEKEQEVKGRREEITAEKDKTTSDAVEADKLFDPETAERSDLLAKYRELEDQVRQAQEQKLRTAAEADNFRKRLLREKEEQTRYANEALMQELLPVVDNLERALQHFATTSNQEGLLEGLNMTLRGFLDTLNKFGCMPLEAVGKPFDPNFHEAVAQEENSEVEPNTVLRELQKGYVLKERLLRPAMVIVSKPNSQAEKETKNQRADESETASTDEVKISVRKV